MPSHDTMWMEFQELRNAILHLVHLFKSATFTYTQVQIEKGKIKYCPEPARPFHLSPAKEVPG